MSRRKIDPVEDVFRRWIALDDDGQARLAAMITGYRAATGTVERYVELTTATKPTRKRTPRPPVVETQEAKKEPDVQAKP